MRPYYCTSGWMLFTLLLLMSLGMGCQSQPKNPGITEVVIQASENSFAERAFIYQKRLEARGAKVISIDSLPDQNLLKIRYEGNWPQSEMAGLFTEKGELSIGPVYPYQEAFPVIQKINDQIRVSRGISIDTTAIEERLEVERFSDLGAANESPMDEETKRFNRENPLFALLVPPRYEDYDVASNTPLVRYASTEDILEIENLLNLSEVVPLIPADMYFAWSVSPFDAELNFYELIALKKADPGVEMIGNKNISEASATLDQQRNQPLVDLIMTPEGSVIWANMTRKAVGNHLAICIDKQVYSYPVVNSEITGGRSQISGNFSQAEAENLAAVLSSKALPSVASVISFEVESDDSSQE